MITVEQVLAKVKDELMNPITIARSKSKDGMLTKALRYSPLTREYFFIGNNKKEGVKKRLFSKCPVPPIKSYNEMDL